MNKLLIAMVAHNVNAAYCLALGDTSQPTWADAPEWQKNSAIAGVDAKLASRDLTPEQMHESWMAVKLQDGWKFGAVKDVAKKEHPCMVPYADLPQAQQVKDHLFSAVVASLASLDDNQLTVAPRAPTDRTPENVRGTAPMGMKGGPVAVQYIGRRETYREALYGSGIVFAKGEIKIVAADLAKQLLKHPDVYALAALPTVPSVSEAAAAVIETTKKQAGDLTEDDHMDIDEAKRSLSTMNRALMAKFAKTNFNHELDAEALSPAEMREKIGLLIEQFGLPK